MRSGIRHSQKGFTLVELMVTMVIFLIVIVMAGNVFSILLGNFKQQSRMSESNIEGNVGLQMLRRDIEQAGYGLPWNLNGATYTEAGQVANPYSTPWTDRNYNDGPPDNPARGTDLGSAPGNLNYNPPGAIRSANNLQTYMNNSDVLILKALNLGTNSTVQKWTYALNTGASTNVFGPVPAVAAEQFRNNDEKVIVVRPDMGLNQRLLITDSAGKFYANFKASGATPSVYSMTDFEADASDAQFLPPTASSLTYIIYGLSPSSITPRMPFNRADYYIRRPDTGMPPKCEPHTGILYKAMLTNNTAVNDTSNPPGSPTTTELPLLECVADMQLAFGLDTNGDNKVDNTSDDINTLTALEIRNQLREVRVYIIAHEGSLDTNYTYTNPNPVTGCTGTNQICISDSGLGLIKAFTVPNRNYRWKLYTMVITPANLR